MSTLSLPQELLDEIFAVRSDWNNPDDLRATSLACRAFTAPSQRVLFSTLIVAGPVWQQPLFSRNDRNTFQGYLFSAQMSQDYQQARQSQSLRGQGWND